MKLIVQKCGKSVQQISISWPKPDRTHGPWCTVCLCSMMDCMPVLCLCRWTVLWITCSAPTRWPSCSRVTCAAPSSGAWRRPACAAVSTQHPLLLVSVFARLGLWNSLRIPHFYFSACKMVCHKKCLSKIITDCSTRTSMKVTVMAKKPSASMLSVFQRRQWIGCISIRCIIIWNIM